MSKTHNPFPGLRSFCIDEKYLFFGREEHTAELLRRLRETRFLAVVGTSGSGKSSLVKAGVLPELHKGTMTKAGSSWEVAVMRPGGSPMTNLAEALVEADLYDPDQPDVVEQVRATLSRSRQGLGEAARQSDLEEGANLLVVVDQFEELFRFRRSGAEQDRAEAIRFVQLLLAASIDPSTPIYVVLTMRSDYLGDCTTFPGLAEAVNAAEFLIPRMNREQRRAAIEGPVKVAGAAMAPRLLQKLLNDLGDDPDQLPILQHALMRTWDVWAEAGDSDALDLDDYQRVGRMDEALSLHADEVYHALASDQEREWCRGIFEALTVKESENRGIRRPQRLATLGEILEVPIDELLPVIDAFRRQGVTFLMPPAEVDLSADTVIDISHESLMRVWLRLRQWVDEEEQAANVYRRLAENATLHARGEAGLFRDPELGLTLSWLARARHANAAWAERYQSGFETAMGFLEKSREAAEAEEREHEAARQRELEQAKQLAAAERLRAEEQKRSAKRLRWLVAASVSAAVLAFLAFLQSQRAETAAEASRNLAEAAQRSLNTTMVLSDFDRGSQALEEGNPGEGLPFLAQAMRRDPSFWQAGMTALSTLTHESFVTEEVKVLRQENPIDTWGFNAESGLAWSLEEEKKGPLGFVWDLKTGAQLYPLGDGQRAEDLRFSRDGARLFAVVDGAVHGWDAPTGTSLGYAVESGENANRQWIETAEGEGFFGMSDAQGLKVFRTEDGQEVPLAPVDGVEMAWPVWAFTPDGERVCALHQDGILAVWSTRSGALMRRIAATSAGQGGKLYLSSDSSLVMAEDGLSQVFNWWPIEPGDGAGAATEPLAFERPVSNVRWLKGNNLIVFHTAPAGDAADRTHEIAVYAPATRAKLNGFSVAEVTHGPVFAGDRFAVVAFVAFVVGGNTVVVKDLATGEEISAFVSADEILELEFRHDGRRLFGTSDSDDTLLHVWDVYTGREVFAPMQLAYRGRRILWQSPEGRRLSIVNHIPSNSLGLLDSESGRRLAPPFTLPSTFNYIDDLGFLRDGVQAVAQLKTDYSSEGLTAGELVVWNADSSTAVLPEPLRDLSAGGNLTVRPTSVRRVEFSRDGRRALLVGRENADVSATRMYFCDVWDTETRRLLFHYRQRGILHDADLDEAGERVAITHPAQLRVSVWDIASGRELLSLPHNGSESTNFTRAVRFSPDGKRLLTLGFDAPNSLHLWDLATGEPVFPPAELKEEVREFHFEGERIHLVTDRLYLEIDADTGQTVVEHGLGEGLIWRPAAISPDFSHLTFSLVPPNEKEIRIIDTASGERLQTLQHDDTIRSVQFSPDGSLMATSTGRNYLLSAGAAYLWDWRTGKQTVPPMDMRAYVDRIRFSPDGSMLAATTRLDGKEAFYLWDVRTGRQVMTPVPLGVESGVYPDSTEIAFRPDGRQLLVAAAKGAIQLIDLPPRGVPLPDFLPRVAEALAGARRVDDSLGAEPVDRNALQALRKEILASDATDGYTRWAQWILTDRATRTVAPDDPRTRSEYLNQLLHRGDKQALHEALLLAPDHALAHARMDYLLATSPELDKEQDPPHRRHWVDSAQWYLDRALELDDANAEVWACQAEVHLRRGEPEAARKAAERAIELAPEGPNANHVLAVTLAQFGDWEPAGEAFRKALAPLTSGVVPDTKTATPLLGLLDKLKVEEIWHGRREVTLPEPIVGTFEDFESVAEGALPAGWQAENHTDDDSRGVETMDLSDLRSDAYKDWIVVSRERVRDFAHGTEDAPAGVRLGVRPNQFLNGAPVRRLLDGKFLTVESNSREGTQFQVLVTPDFDCSARSGVHVAFHGACIQNQDSLTAVEYSVDAGQSWLPVIYRLDGNDVIRDEKLAIDAVATFTRKYGDAPRYRGPDGQWLGEAYGDFIAAGIGPELAPSIEPGLDGDETEFHQVEVFRLPEADGRTTVRLRFAHAGSDSGYWSLDNFGLYAIPAGTPGLEQAPSHITASPVSPAADPDRLLALATELLEKEKASPRDEQEARLLAQRAVDLLPGDPQAMAVHALALGHTGAVEEALAAIDRATALRPDFASFRKTQALIYGTQGEQLLARGRKAEAALCLEIADTLLRSLEATPDQAALERIGKKLAAVGRVREPQVILPRGSFWKFLDDGSDQKTAWRDPGFDDGAWRGGPARIGYDDGSKADELTAVRTRVGFGPDPANKHITTYLRATFEFADPGRPQDLRLFLQRDDGVVIYLNGTKIGRSNMPSGPVQFDTPAASAVSVTDEATFYNLEAPANALRPGRNVVAVELHQANGRSSDLGFDLEIAAGGIDLASYPAAAELSSLEESLRIPAEIRSLLWMKRAELFLGAGDEPRGEECLERMLAIDPEDPQVPYARAKIAAAAKDEAAAAAAYHSALELAMRTRPASPQRLFLPGALATLAWVSGNSPQAMARATAQFQEGGGEDWEVAALDRLLQERAPDDLAVKRIRVGLLIGLGRHEEALSLIDALQAGNPERQWTIIEPTRIESEGGESFTVQDDGSVVVGGENPERSVYRLTLPASGAKVTSLRLEVLRNSDGASGRAENGHAILAEFGVSLQSNGTGSDDRIPVLRAWGTEWDTDAHAAAIDGDPGSYWAINRSQSCFFELANPRTPQGDERIQVTIDSGTAWKHHGLARFRLSVSGAAEAIIDSQRIQSLLRQKETCYRALGQDEEADTVKNDRLFPARAADLDPRQINLDTHYNASLYDGAGWSSSADNNLASLPETFVPLKGVGFDLRGIVQLESGTLPDGQTLNRKANRQFPPREAAIEIGQTSSVIHFLTSCQWGREEPGVEVASFVMHYADGTSDIMAVKFLDDIADWNGSGGSIPDAQVGWRGIVNRNIALSELVWKNPHPKKVIVSIDFISAKAKAAPFLVGITLE